MDPLTKASKGALGSLPVPWLEPAVALPIFMEPHPPPQLSTATAPHTEAKCFLHLPVTEFLSRLLDITFMLALFRI